MIPPAITLKFNWLDATPALSLTYIPTTLSVLVRCEADIFIVLLPCLTPAVSTSMLLIEMYAVPVPPEGEVKNIGIDKSCPFSTSQSVNVDDMVGTMLPPPPPPFARR